MLHGENEDIGDTAPSSDHLGRPNGRPRNGHAARDIRADTGDRETPEAELRNVGRGGASGRGGMRMQQEDEGHRGLAAQSIRRRPTGSLPPGQRRGGYTMGNERGERIARANVQPHDDEADADDQSSIAGDSVITPRRARREDSRPATEAPAYDPRHRQDPRRGRAASVAAGERRRRTGRGAMNMMEMRPGDNRDFGGYDHTGLMRGGYGRRGRGYGGWMG